MLSADFEPNCHISCCKYRLCETAFKQTQFHQIKTDKGLLPLYCINTNSKCIRPDDSSLKKKSKKAISSFPTKFPTLSHLIYANALNVSQIKILFPSKDFVCL